MKPLSFVSLLMALTLTGCGVSQQEHDVALARIHELEEANGRLTAQVADLQNTPSLRLTRAAGLREAGKAAEAEREYRDLIGRFPQSPEAETARDVIAALEAEREAEREAEARRQQLGFRALSAADHVTVGPAEVAIRSVATRRQWTFDRYDDSWHYRDARRGLQYVIAELAVTSSAHDPLLPPIDLYRVDGGRLTYLSTMAYEFYRWDDYGSYLGNNADYGNDFAHTETIRFTAAAEVADSVLAGPLMVFVGEQGCFARTRNEFGNPEISYQRRSCNLAPSLTVDTAEQGRRLVRVLNADRL